MGMGSLLGKQSVRLFCQGLILFSLLLFFQNCDNQNMESYQDKATLNSVGTDDSMDDAPPVRDEELPPGNSDEPPRSGPVEPPPGESDEPPSGDTEEAPPEGTTDSPPGDMDEPPTEDNDDNDNQDPADPNQALLNKLEGFASGTTGGLGGTTCVVANLNDGGKGSLRDCVSSAKSRWVVFAVSGEIQLKSAVKVRSNTTVDGREARIVITGHGLAITKAENVIIHNLTVQDVKDDAIKIYQSKKVWINHLTLQRADDGLLDITNGSTDVTVSYTKLMNHNKTMLIGANDSHTEDANTRVTLHHNLFYNTIRRNPLVRFAKVHMYNNLLKHWGDGNSGDGINATITSQLRVENNIFEANNKRPAMRTAIPKWTEIPGYIAESGSWTLGGAKAFSEGADKVFEAKSFYEYNLESANEALKQTLLNETGAY